VSPVARRGAPRRVTSRRRRRRLAVLAALVATLVAAGAAPAAAHPLGNFTVNTYSGLRVGPDRLVVDYVLDLAEIPAFQARQGIDGDHDGRVGGAEAAGWRDRECPRLAGGLRASVDGRPLPLAVTASRLTFPRGVGGLETLRLECALAAPLPAGRPAGRALAYADGNQQGRVGWREITAVGDRTTLEATDVPAASASARLTTYPSDQLSSPLNQRTATLRFHPGGPAAPGWSGPPAPGSPVAGSAGGNLSSRCEALRGAREPDPAARGPPEGERSRARDEGRRAVHSPGRRGRRARRRGRRCRAGDPGWGGPGHGGVRCARE
jgi:hypothetical protein